MADATRDIWTRKDVADRFGCSIPHVVNLARTQGLPHFRLGRLWRFRRVEVLAWEEAQIELHAKDRQTKERLSSE